MRTGFNQSIAFRFSVLVFIISLGIGIIASCIELYMTFQENKNLARESIQQVTESHIPSLISSLWLTHSKLLQEQVNAIERFKYIAGVELTDSDNNQFSAGETLNPNHRLIKRELFYEFRGKKTPIGALKLYIDDNQIKKDSFDREIPSFELHFLQSLIVAFVIGFMFRGIIGRHLEAFSRHLVKSRDDFSMAHFRFDRKRTYHDELESLLKSFDVLMSARTKAEEQLKISLKEKETLLQEIHHRVKNNMNVVSGLLSLHINLTQNEEVKKALQESQGRVYAMSMVHESLYNSENMAEIDLLGYMNNLSISLLQTYSIGPGKVDLKIDGDEVKVSINKASPLGLTINELISNALKYAFPDDRKGEILVATRKQDDRLELVIRDNGVGMPEGFDWKNSSTLGLKLVRSLIENQLNGSIDVATQSGTQFTIKIDLDA